MSKSKNELPNFTIFTHVSHIDPGTGVRVTEITQQEPVAYYPSSDKVYIPKSERKKDIWEMLDTESTEEITHNSTSISSSSDSDSVDDSFSKSF